MNLTSRPPLPPESVRLRNLVLRMTQHPASIKEVATLLGIRVPTINDVVISLEKNDYMVKIEGATASKKKVDQVYQAIKTEFVNYTGVPKENKPAGHRIEILAQNHTRYNFMNHQAIPSSRPSSGNNYVSGATLSGNF